MEAAAAAAPGVRDYLKGGRVQLERSQVHAGLGEDRPGPFSIRVAAVSEVTRTQQAALRPGDPTDLLILEAGCSLEPA